MKTMSFDGFILNGNTNNSQCFVSVSLIGIVTWLTREYVYLWYRLLEINVGTRDTAADEMQKMALNKGNNKITELRTILQKESQNS